MIRKNLLKFLIVVLMALSFQTCRSEENNIEHVFLVTLDTLRADHLSVYDYPRETAPFISSLSEKGVVFRNSFSNSATTLPAHASIFTSYYPIQHKVEKNWIVLDKSFITIAEILKESEFDTYAFTSSELFKANDMYQGFSYFNEPENTRKIFGKKYRPAGHTRRSIESFFNKKKKNGKTFIWIHLFDPHRPYYPPSEYMKKIEEMDDKREIVSFLKDNHKIDPDIYKGYIFRDRGRSDFFKKNPDHYDKWLPEDIMYDQINLYDAEIMYIDDQLKKIFNYFEKSGLNKNSLWIITGDHGEGLGNHDWFMHAREIYTEAIKIPLILYSPGLIKPAAHDHYTEHIDIFPSLLDLLNIKDPTNNLFADSFADLVTGKDKMFKKEFLFAKREIYKKRIMKKAVPGFMNYEHGDKFSIISGDFHYIFRTEGENELFDLSIDPYEINNVISKSEELENKLKKILFSVMKSSRINLKVKKANADQINKIKALGYVE